MSVFGSTVLQNKVALVTGGGTGICFGISKQFLLHGATVYIIHRKIENINAGIERLKRETGQSKAFGSICDVRD
jgi:peroxisomal 2,4-dienoyl-CoA reductase